MTDSPPTRTAPAEVPRSPAFVARIAHANGKYECVTLAPELANALGVSPRADAAPRPDLRELVGPTAFDARLRDALDAALAGNTLRARILLDLPGHPQRVLDSLTLPAPAAGGATGEAIWIATDITLASRLHDTCSDLGRRALAGQLRPAELEREAAHRLAHTFGGVAEIWELADAKGSRAERTLRCIAPGPARAARPAKLDLSDAEVQLLAAGSPFPWPRGEAEGGTPRSPALPRAVPILTRGRATGFLLLEPGPRPAWAAPWSADEERPLTELALLLGALRERSGARADAGRAAAQRTRERLTGMARGMAHDFNNVLVGILGGLELASHEVEPGTDLEADLNLIRNSAERATRLCRSMQALTGEPHGRRDPIDLNRVVEETARGSAAALEPDLELATDLAPVASDPEQVARIVDCLLANALAATARDGRVTLRTLALPGPLPSLQDGAGQDWVLPPAGASGDAYAAVEVADDGPGIPAHDLDRVFDPFFTTRPGSSGLGLSVVLGLAGSLGAGVQLRSSPGRGTTVRVVFAASARAPGDAPGEAGAGLVAHGGKPRVLVVDDDPAVLDTLSRMLRANGCEVLGASDPREALEEARRPGPPIDAAVVDFEMPGMNGPEAISRLREIRPGLHAVLVSGKSTGRRTADGHVNEPGRALPNGRGEADQEPARREPDPETLDPPVAFLQKPFTAEELLRALPSARDGSG